MTWVLAVNHWGFEKKSPAIVSLWVSAGPQGGPACNVRVMTAVCCPQAQAPGGSVPAGACAWAQGLVQGGAGRVSAQHAAAWPPLRAEISQEHAPAVEDPLPPVLQIMAVTAVVPFLLSLSFWKRSTWKRRIRACWLQWLESRTRLNIALLSPVGPQEGTGVHKWECPAGAGSQIG
uniref:Uncharacterized protein n=1 Tax=Rangifer tarandus platyrhynchus TaxID=3082113 RepID=A0ACB0EFQ9_RANTA|nr:unnamed protein product [Rangifer tarandus platyrhynchus]